MTEELLEGENEEPENEEELLDPLQGSDEDQDAPPEPAPVATLDQLKKKQRVTKTTTVAVTGDDGEPVRVSMKFQGIPAHHYDRLISRFPPRSKDKKQGYNYNPDEFGPALLAATCIDPEMTVDDAKEIWSSENWNRGERMMLLMTAIEVCTTGLNVPFKKSVSG